MRKLKRHTIALKLPNFVLKVRIQYFLLYIK